MRTNNIAAVAAQYRRQKERDGGKRRGAHSEPVIRKGQPGLPGRAGGKDMNVPTMPAGLSELLPPADRGSLGGTGEAGEGVMA